MVNNWKALEVPCCKDEKQKENQNDQCLLLTLLFLIFDTSGIVLNSYEMLMAYRKCSLRKQQQMTNTFQWKTFEVYL